MDVCAVDLYLILHRCHVISFFSPVNGVRKRRIAAEVVPFGSRAVLLNIEQYVKTIHIMSKNIYFKVLANCFLNYLRFRQEERLLKFTKCHVWKLVQPHCRKKWNKLSTNGPYRNICGCIKQLFLLVKEWFPSLCLSILLLLSVNIWSLS